MADVTRIDEPVNVHPSRGYSHAAVHDGWVFVSGQVPVARDGTVVAREDIVGQAEQAFANLIGVLAAAGAGPADILKLTYYLTSMPDLPIVIAARDRHIRASAAPASTVVEVRALYHPDVRVEIEAIARVTS